MGNTSFGLMGIFFGLIFLIFYFIEEETTAGNKFLIVFGVCWIVFGVIGGFLKKS